MLRLQYDESDANYFNRRCEEKGWSYWFTHRFDGHTLVISDDTTTQAELTMLYKSVKCPRCGEDDLMITFNCCRRPKTEPLMKVVPMQN